MRTVLHVAPHPDDESVGAPCTLLALRDAGARVVVATGGLGRPADHARRRRELAAACAAGGFELVLPEPPLALGSTDDLVAAERDLAGWAGGLVDELGADLVLSPHEHDAHPAHEATARAVRRAVAGARRPPTWWAWGFWSDLRAPTLLHACPAALVERAAAVLAHHGGEVARNDYVALLRAAGRLAAGRGVERVLGFGAPALPGVEHAELLTERTFAAGRWRRGRPRVDHLPYGRSPLVE